VRRGLCALLRRREVYKDVRTCEALASVRGLRVRTKVASMDTDTLVAPTRTRDATARFNLSVHGARGLFAFAVYLFHIVNSGLATWPILEAPAALLFLRTAEYGVELFFGISGFVICGTLRRARSPAAFLEDRAIRIYPVLWVTILTIVALGLATNLHGFEEVSRASLFWRIPANLLALPGIFPIDPLHPAAWSLSYEGCFYIFCAVIWSLRLWLGRWTIWPMVALAAVTLAFYPRGVLFLSGALVAEGFLNHRRFALVIRFPFLWLMAFLLTWHEIQVLSDPRHIAVTTLFEWAQDARLPLGIIAFAAATLGFAGIAGGYGLFGRMLRTPVLQYLGTISYSFYLWHPLAMSSVKTLMKQTGLAAASGNGAQAMFLLLTLPPSLIAAHFSQRILERNAGLWLRRRMHHTVPLQTAALESPQPST
jgi:peptidoglycan/LPS O-acetylase OafA/YrhL